MAEKIQNSFYLLKEEVDTFNKVKRKHEKQIVDSIYLEKIFKNKGYKPQVIISKITSKFDVKLYYKRTRSPVNWKEFIATIAQTGQDILKHPESYSESYILLLQSKKTNQIFTSTGGYGHMVIQDIATNDLGIEILARIVKAEDKALRSTKEQSFTGGIQGSVKIFRNDYNFYDNESFGSIYSELNASLTKQKLMTLFGFQLKELRSDSLCIAKNSFSIKKSVSFKDLLRIIQACEDILTKPKTVEVNAVVKINRTNSVLINSLNEAIDQKVFDNYKKKDDFFSVEICHKDFEKYYFSTITKLHITIARKTTVKEYDEPIRIIQTIIEVIRSIAPKLSKADFYKAINGGTVQTLDSDGNTLTADYIRNHYCTEIKIGSKSYFLIEKDWYEISKSMIDKIDETCGTFVKEKKYAGPVIHKWNSTFSMENDFNASFIGKPNCLVFDRITPLNIEVCDILVWDKEYIYLHHVKKGFDNSMRDLCQQVSIAARKVVEDSKSSYHFIGALYDKLNSNSGKSLYITKAKGQLTKLPKDDFVNLFRSRKIVFVLSVLDTSKKSARKLEKDIHLFNSNIAKFSLNELCKIMRNLDIPFQILQLDK